MSRGQRIGALATAAVIAVVAFVVLGPAQEGPDNARETSSTQAPGGGGEKQPSQQPAAEAAPSYTTIEVRDGEPVGGPKEISLEKGDTARIELRSNRAGELHIHGYDEYVDLKAGKPARTRFRANLEGIFEIEDHDTGTQVAELRVEP
jgi:hypothetical protein